MGNAGLSQGALVIVDARPSNTGETVAFQKPSVGTNWSHVHWGATGDWYIRSASSGGRVILQDTGGSVGIATGNPQANLDVGGAMALNGRLALSSDSYLRLNQNNAFENGVHTPGLFSSASINVGGFGGWVSPGFGNLAVAGNINTAGQVRGTQFWTDGQSWLQGQVHTGDLFGHWESGATLKLWDSDIWDTGEWLQLRSGGGKIYMHGEVTVQGALHKGGGGFKIDHPLDPEHKYLSHSFVESSEMVNLYVGTVVTDEDGAATVTLPTYFEAINRDHRFQLTPIGRLALATVDGEIEGNAFTIRTDKPGVTVSWQVTGVRQDPWAEANRIVVEHEKPAAEQDLFLHPEIYGHSEDLALGPVPAQAPQPQLEETP
jgi:hypothetical protein